MPPRSSTVLTTWAGHVLGAVLSPRLAVEVWLYRHGWIWPLLAAFTIVGGVLTWSQRSAAVAAVEALQQELVAEQARAQSGTDGPVASPIDPTQPLREALSLPVADAPVVDRIHQLAGAAGVVLQRGRYSRGRLAPSGIESTEASFSFSGQYPATRNFVEAVLRDHPAISVDRIAIERNQAADAQVEVTVRLALWRWPTGRAQDTTP
jgi:hypothetical protein